MTDAYSQAINWARGQATHPMRTYVAKGQIPENLHALGLDNPYNRSSAYGWPTRSRSARTLDELAATLGLPITNGF
jgi:hypothetical protein